MLVGLLVLVALLPFALAAPELTADGSFAADGVQLGASGGADVASLGRHLSGEGQQELQELIAGVPGRLVVVVTGMVLWNPQLYRAGRVRIRPIETPCGGPGSSVMSSTVQPPCAGSVCLGPPHRAGQEVSWEGVRITRVGRYQLCWCSPRNSCAGPDAGMVGRGCCHGDRDFSRAVGHVQVHGPAWVSLFPALGAPFNIDLMNPVVHWSSRVQLRFQAPIGKGICGEKRSALELEVTTMKVRNSRFEEGKAKFEGQVFRGVPYLVCWCAGERHQSIDQDCKEDEAFAGEVGYVNPIGPNTEGLTPQRAVVGAPFSVMLRGLGLGTGDRVRVVDGSERCGTDTSQNAFAVAQYVCGRGTDECVESPVYNWPPSELENFTIDDETVESVGKVAGVDEYWEASWKPVVVFATGTYNLCWCVDNSWDPERLESNGLCVMNHQFAVAAGTVVVEGIFDGQQFECTAFAPCTLEVFSPMPMSSGDAIMIAAQRKDVWYFCGRGMQGLYASVSSVRSMGNASNTSNTGNASNASIVSTASSAADLDMGNHSAIFQILPNAGPAGDFPICFCQSDAVGTCDDPAVFGQLAGTLRVSPPSDGIIRISEPTKFCDMTSACRFAVIGVWAIQLHNNDAFGVVQQGERCGKTQNLGVFRLERRIPLSDGEWKAVYVASPGQPFPESTGDYRLCYCSASLTSGKKECMIQTDFNQDMAGLVVLGATVSGYSWICKQSRLCNVTVPGWHIHPSDRLLLVQLDTPCGGSGYDDIMITLGFDANPAFRPWIQPIARGDTAEFSFGRALGAGHSRVCFCASTTAATGCQDFSDFLQDVGKLTVTGSLVSVEIAATHTPTAFAITVVVDVMKPGQVVCAVANASLPKPPSIYQIMYCQDQLPGCLGMSRLPWRAFPGRLMVHIPIELESAAPIRPKAHVWCIGDVTECSGTGYCAMPPTGAGLELILEDGSLNWTEKRVIMEESTNVAIHGKPLLTRNGFAASHFASDQSDCANLARDDRNDALALGEPTVVQPGLAVSWRGARVTRAGVYRLCWCDRSYAYDYCVLWRSAGLITVAGPTGDATVPSVLAEQQAYNILLRGVNLTMQGRIRLVLLPSSPEFEGVAISMEAEAACKNRTLLDAQNASAPVWANGSHAEWNSFAPRSEGYYALCWGEEGGSLSVRAGHVFVQERRDCVISNWTELACDQLCGGGTFEEHREILQIATGGGEPCPPPGMLVRRSPCNTEPCPEAQALTAWTAPFVIRTGEAFQVHVEGQDFAPEEDRVILVSGEASCNSTSSYAAGAACGEPGSNTTKLVCGDGKVTLRVADPGLYRICICDASRDVPTNASGAIDSPNTSRVACGGDLSAYTLMPMNGSVFSVSGPRMPLESLVDFDEEDLQAQAGQESQEKAHLYDSDSAEGGIPLIVLTVLAVCIVVFGILIFAVWCRYFRPKQKLQKEREKAKESLESNTEELVRQATREVWNAYARAVAEGVDDEELREASHAILDANAAEEEEEAARKDVDGAASIHSGVTSSRRWSLNSSSTESSLYSDEETTSSQLSSTVGTLTRAATPSTPGLSRLPTPARTPPATPGPSRLPTPARTPPATPGPSRVPTPSTAGQRTATPCTARTARTAGSARTPTPGTARTARSVRSLRSVSRPSLLQHDLPTAQDFGKPPTAPKAGGSFLDMPLLGRSATGGGATDAAAESSANRSRSATPPPAPPDAEPPVLENGPAAPPSPRESPPEPPLAEPPSLAVLPAETEHPASDMDRAPDPPPPEKQSLPEPPPTGPPPLAVPKAPLLAAGRPRTPIGRPPPLTALELPKDVDQDRGPLEGTPGSTPPGSPPDSYRHAGGSPDEVPTLEAILSPMASSALPSATARPPGLKGSMQLPPSLQPPGKSLSPDKEPSKVSHTLPPRPLGLLSGLKLDSRAAASGLTLPATLPPPPPPPQAQPQEAEPQQPVSIADEAADFIRSLMGDSQTQSKATDAVECKPPEPSPHDATSAEPLPLSSCQDNDDEPFKDTRSTWSGIGSMFPGSMAGLASPSSNGTCVKTPPREISPRPDTQQSQDAGGQAELTSESVGEEPTFKPPADLATQSLPDLSAEVLAQSVDPSPVVQGGDEAAEVTASAQVKTSSVANGTTQASSWSISNMVGNLRLPWARSKRSKSAAHVSAMPLAAISESAQQPAQQEQPSLTRPEPQESLRSKHQPRHEAGIDPQRERSTQASESAVDFAGANSSELDLSEESPKNSPLKALPRLQEAEQQRGDVYDDLAKGDKVSPEEGSTSALQVELPGSTGLELERVEEEETLGSISPSTQGAMLSPADPNIHSSRLDGFLSDDGSSPATSTVASQRNSRWGHRDDRPEEQLSEAALETGRSSLAESHSNSTMTSSRYYGLRGKADTQDKIRAEWHRRLKAGTDWDKVEKASSPKSASLRPRGENSARPSASSLRSAASRRGAGASSQAPSAASSPRSLSTSGVPEGRSTGSDPEPPKRAAAPGPALPGMPGPGLPGMMPGPALPGMPGPALPGMPGQSARLLPGPASSSPKGQMLPGPPFAGAQRPNPHGRQGAPGGMRPPSWAFVAP